jgi:hypothetical protein
MRNKKSPQSFAFVSVDNVGKAKASDRRLIRSHCMIGKNKGKFRIDGDRHAEVDSSDHEFDVFQAPRLSFAQTLQLSLVLRDVNPILKPLLRDYDVEEPRGYRQRRDEEELEVGMKIPPAPPSDLCLVKFAGDVNRHSRNLLHKCKPSLSLLL